MAMRPPPCRGRSAIHPIRSTMWKRAVQIQPESAVTLEPPSTKRSHLLLLRWRSVHHRVHEYMAMKMSRGRMGEFYACRPCVRNPQWLSGPFLWRSRRDKVPRAEFPPERELRRDAHS